MKLDNFYNKIFLTKEYKNSHSKKEIKTALIRSIAIDIFSLGIVHGVCGLVHAAKSLRSRRKIIRSEDQSISLKENKSIKSDTSESAKNSQTSTSDVQQSALTHPMMENSAPIIVSPQVEGGHCAWHALNNALQGEVATLSLFQTYLINGYCELLHLDYTDALMQVRPDAVPNGDRFEGDVTGTDPAIFCYAIEQTLGIKSKQTTIKDLLNDSKSKEKAITDFLGSAEWAIVANISSSAVCESYYDRKYGEINVTISRGHFCAIRKDHLKNWWLLDSLEPHPTPISLEKIPEHIILITYTTN